MTDLGLVVVLVQDLVVVLVQDLVAALVQDRTIGMDLDLVVVLVHVLFDHRISKWRKRKYLLTLL